MNNKYWVYGPLDYVGIDWTNLGPIYLGGHIQSVNLSFYAPNDANLVFHDRTEIYIISPTITRSKD